MISANTIMRRSAPSNCPLCLGGACMWRVERQGVVSCEPPARLRAKASVRENVAALNAALSAVTSHHMCLRFFEDQTHYTVHYPEGFYPNGCRAPIVMGRAKALTKMLEMMDRHWDENGIHGTAKPPSAATQETPDPSP